MTELIFRIIWGAKEEQGAEGWRRTRLWCVCVRVECESETAAVRHWLRLASSYFPFLIFPHCGKPTAGKVLLPSHVELH